METFREKINRLEFEYRIFISIGIVIAICLPSFILFSHHPSLSVLFGKILNFSPSDSTFIGNTIIVFILIIASILRMWAGSILSSPRVMAFKVKTDSFINSGPYRFSRNPIYLADFLAFCSFSLCLPAIGILLPFLIYQHYRQLIKYEEKSLVLIHQIQFSMYKKEVKRLIPSPWKLPTIYREIKSLSINRDGFRHNGLYLLFIPGFIVAAFTQQLSHAIIIGIPAVIDWAIIHTRLGVSFSAKEKIPPQKFGKKILDDILYAQCWEDPAIDRIAFNIESDDVIFSITSGGCNVLTFLLDNPQKIIALDINPYQNYLLSLKIAAICELDYQALLEFVGVKKSKRRLLLYQKIRPSLEKPHREYWDKNKKKIQKGIIHCGRYETYMKLLRKTIQLCFGKPLIKKFFFAEDPSEKRLLYRKRWENAWWWLITRILLSRKMMTFLFDRGFFAQLQENFSFGEHFAEKAKHLLTHLPMKKNYFACYILLGNYYNRRHLPPYLKKENVPIIRSRINRIETVTTNCKDYFQHLPDSSISKFNFSNIFEWMTASDFEDLLKESIRVARAGAIITYRNLLVQRNRPASLKNQIQPLTKLAKTLHQADLSFIYNNYIVEKIIKEETTCATMSEQFQTVER